MAQWKEFFKQVQQNATIITVGAGRTVLSLGHVVALVSFVDCLVGSSQHEVIGCKSTGNDDQVD